MDDLAKLKRWIANGMPDQSSNTDSQDALRHDLESLLSAHASALARVAVLEGANETAISTAAWMFRAAMSGIAARDVREGRMTSAEAKAWVGDASASFERDVRDMIRAALRTEGEGQAAILRAKGGNPKSSEPEGRE